MTNDDFDPFRDGSSTDAWAALNCFGALKETVAGTALDFCTYNLGPILLEVRDHLIPYMGEFADASDQDWEEDEITNGVNKLLDQIQSLASNSIWLAEVCPDLNKRKLMQGYMVDFPLYSLLPYLPSEVTEVEKFRRYKSVLLLCGLELRRHAAEKAKDYRAALRSAANALRLMTNSPLLKYLPEIEELSLAEVHKEFVKLEPGSGFSATPTEVNYVRAVTALLKFVVDKTGGTPRKKREVQADIDSSENEVGVRVRTSRGTDYTAKEIQEAKKSGLAMAEMASDLELITEDIHHENGEDEDAHACQQIRTLSRQAMSRQRQLEGIERGAQLLPNSVNRLTTGEIAAYLSHIQKIANTSNCSSLQIEAASALVSSFWLSKTLQESLQLVIYAGYSNLPKSLPVGFLGYLQESNEWVIPSIQPKGAPKHKGIDLSVAIPVQPFIRLPDISGSHQFFAKLKTWERAKLSKEGVRAFGSSGASIESVCNQIIKTVKKETHGRVTMSRAKDTVFLLTLDQCQDKAVAIMTLARPHRLGDTQLHYTTVPVCMLQQVYCETCRVIVKAMVLENSFLIFSQQDPALTAVQYSPQDLFVGCVIRPSEASIRKLVDELAFSLKRMRCSITDLQSRVNFSNLYTAYTIFFLWHVTGVRAVNQPIPSHKYIDWRNKLLLASDKDDYTSFNTRLVPMVEVLIEQLNYYLSFQKDLVQRYRLTLQKSDRTFNKKVDSDETFFYFFELTGERMMPIEASQRRVMDQIRKESQWFGLPANCHRSRLRSALLERRCPPQWIDALLGHWTRGEEPWHRFASTSLLRVTEGLRVHLEEIADQDGWIAIRGIV